MICDKTNLYRLLLRLIVNPNSLLREDTETSYGFTIHYMRTILELWSHLLPRNKLLVDLIPILLSLEELHLREC